MKLFHLGSGEALDAEIKEMDEETSAWVKRSSEFSFDWTTEHAYEIYTIYLLKDDRNILGLMSLIDRPDEYRVHLNLLEVSKSNQGRQKSLDNIAGCLIAFAAEEAFKRGYFGFVSLEPKTQLIEHYRQQYGFSQYGRYLGIEGTASQQLIKAYLGYE
ncbi:MAG: GNAT family N-acetyltransferase [Bacteroidota bacterium]